MLSEIKKLSNKWEVSIVFTIFHAVFAKQMKILSFYFIFIQYIIQEDIYTLKYIACEEEMKYKLFRRRGKLQVLILAFVMLQLILVWSILHTIPSS